MATNLEVNEIVIYPLELLMEPRIPKTLKTGPNPKYPAYIELFLKALGPLPVADLRAGMDLFLQRRKFFKWPVPGEIFDCCVQVQKEQREQAYASAPRTPPSHQIEAPPEQTKEERHAMADRCKRLVLAFTSGRDMHSEETRRWVYSGESHAGP